MIERSVIASTKEAVVAGKRYIGTGQYKDTDGYIWDLERAGSDWVIRRVGDYGNVKCARKPETAEEYWRKILTSEMVDVMFKHKVALTNVVGVLSPVANVQASMEIGEQAGVTVAKVFFNEKGELIIYIMSSDNDDWVGREQVIPLLQEALDAVAAMSDLEKVGFYSDLVSTETFKMFIALDVLG